MWRSTASGHHALLCRSAVLALLISLEPVQSLQRAVPQLSSLQHGAATSPWQPAVP